MPYFVQCSHRNIKAALLALLCTLNMLSPKKTLPPQLEIFKRAHELKVIVYNADDLKWAEENAIKMNDDSLFYLQPEWSKSKEMMPLIVDYVMKNPKWNISLQTHKYMNIP